MANFHSINGNEVEAHYAGGDLQDEIDLKAETDGYYTMLTAGAADNLTARGDGVTASYLYRTTGGSASVPDDAEATVRSIKGRTLGWNQHVKTGANNWSVTSGTKSYVDDVITVTPNGGEGFTYCTVSQDMDIHGTASHKYLVSLDFLKEDWSDTAASSNYAFPTLFGSWLSQIASLVPSKTVTTWQHLSGIVSQASDSPSQAFTFRSYGNTYPFSIKNVMVVDLTAMFGAGNEPATVAEFEALYPLPYYPYDAGSLLPVNMTGVETVGFNQWDEEWEVGGLNDDGIPISASGRIRSKNFIPVIGGAAYFFTNSASVSDNFINVYFYDAGYERIGYNGVYSPTSATNPSFHNPFTVPQGARYLKFATSSTYGTVYNHDICINLSWSGYRDGEYEPYWSEQRVIAAIAENFPNGMRSARSVADELTEHEAIVRVGAVDLADITWTDSTNCYSTAYVLPNAKTPASGGVVANMSCADYEVTSSNNVSAGVVSNGIGLRPNGTLYVSKGSASPAGMLFYELATPTTTTFPHPINMDYRFADFGTERVMVPTGQMSAPPTMDVVYGLNAPDTLRTLPTEYVSKASDASFTAALGTFLNATITREWNETNQRYDYTITANGE